MTPQSDMQENPYLWELSAFDTEMLGFPAAKISEINGDTPEILTTIIRSLVQELTEKGVRHAVVRVPASDYMTIQSLEQNGFVLVDGLITLRSPVPKDGVSYTDLIEVASREDAEQLMQLTGSVFRGVSRYYHDPAISEESADAVYRKWMENSLQGSAADTVLVAKESAHILGFITLRKKEGHGDIPLVGVSALARGKAIGKSLIRAAVSTCAKWGFSEITVATQVTNIPALRLYQSCGFSVTASHLTFRWFASK